MLVHGRPFTKVLVSDLPDDLSRAHQPVFHPGHGDSPGSIAEVRHAESAALDPVSAA